MRRVIVSLVLVLGCAPQGPSASVPLSAVTSAAASASASPRAGTQLLVTGKRTTVTPGANMQAGFAHRGTLYALAMPTAPPPYVSELLRSDAATGTWAEVFSDDAWFQDLSFDGGRAALVEYRGPFQGGGGFDERVLVVALATRATTRIDAFAVSSATFRGGGGGPGRPGWRIVLHGEQVAWTRLN